jgi:F0F1-type ATP synthase membrane subunit b/b'
VSAGRRARAEQLPEAEARLRELLAEAHGAIQDLGRLLREFRAVSAGNAQAARDAAYTAGCEQITLLSSHLQEQMNQAATDLNDAVTRARHDVMEAITPTAIHIVDADEENGQRGLVTIEFAGNLFDDKIEVKAT